MADQDYTKSQLQSEIETWLNRAALAYKHDDLTLSQQALHQSWQYQKQLSELEGSEPPDQPHDAAQFFSTWDSTRIDRAVTQAFPIREYMARAFGKPVSGPENLPDWLMQSVKAELKTKVMEEMKHLRQPDETDEQFERKLAQLVIRFSEATDENEP